MGCLSSTIARALRLGCWGFALTACACRAETWDSIVQKNLLADWDILHPAITAYADNVTVNKILNTKLIIHPLDKPGVICENTGSPAYTTLNSDGNSEINICITNYGFVEALFEGIAFGQIFYEMRAKPDDEGMRNFEGAYMFYLASEEFNAQQASDLGEHYRGYCPGSMFLYLYLHSSDYMRCAEVVSGKTPVGYDAARWNLTETLFPQFNAWRMQKTGKSSNLAEYHEQEDILIYVWFRWSYRSILLHEFGHIVTGDIGDEGGNEAAEIKDDNAAMGLAERILGQVDYSTASIPIDALASAEYFLSEYAAISTGHNISWISERINNISSAATSAHILAERDSVNGFAPGFATGFGAFRSPFTNCQVTYGRNIHESYAYQCSAAHVKNVYVGTRTIEFRGIAPTTTAKPFAFSCPIRCLPH